MYGFDWDQASCLGVAQLVYTRVAEEAGVTNCYTEVYSGGQHLRIVRSDRNHHRIHRHASRLIRLAVAVDMSVGRGHDHCCTDRRRMAVLHCHFADTYSLVRLNKAEIVVALIDRQGRTDSV